MIRNHTIHVAGLLVTGTQGGLDEVAARLALVAGLEVHARDPATGRLLVTLETTSIEEQQARFEWILSLPGVITVDLVCHFFDSVEQAARRVSAPAAGGPAAQS